MSTRKPATYKKQTLEPTSEELVLLAKEQLKTAMAIAKSIFTTPEPDQVFEVFDRMPDDAEAYDIEDYVNELRLAQAQAVSLFGEEKGKDADVLFSMYDIIFGDGDGDEDDDDE